MRLENGTGNTAIREKSVAIGQGAVTVGYEQTALGRYPEIPSGDASADAMVFGGGHKGLRHTAARITSEGEFLTAGGYPVYMTNPHTLEICKVYMIGKNNNIKQVNLSR